MLRDYNKVLQFLRKVDDYAVRVYGKHLADIDKEDYRSVLDCVYFKSDFCAMFRECKKAWAEVAPDIKEHEEVISGEFWQDYIQDIHIMATVEEMSENDLMCFLNCLVSSQIGDFIIIRYNEIRIFNNIVVTMKATEMYDKLLRECRSIVVNIRDFTIVSLPFYKFMNLNEAADYMAQTVMDRLHKAKVVEYSDKMDGSFVQITKLDKDYDFYPYSEVLTSSKNIWDTPIVDGARAWYEAHENYKELVRSYPEYTLMFESISMDDKHIVRYTKEQTGLYLIGMRHKESGELLSYAQVVKIADTFGVLHTDVYDISFEQLQKNLSKFKAGEKEGYVINIDGFLVKMKCEDYVSMVAIIKENGHDNSVIKAISNDSLGELKSLLPEEYLDGVNEVAEEIYEYIELIDSKIKQCLDYMDEVHLDRVDVEKWCKGLPYCMSGTVRSKYFCKLNNKPLKFKLDYLRTNNSQLVNNYINMAELKRRKKVVQDFDLSVFLATK